MLRLRDLIFDMLSALVIELAEQHGMAGDDDAGRTFASVYKESARTVVDQLSHASFVMSRGAQGLLATATNYIAAESAAAAELLGDSGDTGGFGSAVERGLHATAQPPGRGPARGGGRDQRRRPVRVRRPLSR